MTDDRTIAVHVNDALVHVNDALWSEFEKINTFLHEADTVVGVLVIGYGKGHELEYDYNSALRKLWRHMCKVRKRPCIIAHAGYGHVFEVRIPKTVKARQILAWWAMAGDTPGVKLDSGATVLTARVDVNNSVWGSFIDQLKTNPSFWDCLKLPPLQ